MDNALEISFQVLLGILGWVIILYGSYMIANKIAKKYFRTTLRRSIPTFTWLFLLLLTLIIITGKTVSLIDNYRYKRHFSKSYLRECIAFRAPNETTDPYIKRKAIIINVEENKIADITFNFGKSFPIAHNTDEVGTIILLKYYEVPVGTYFKKKGSITVGASITAYRIDCDVTIIDKDKSLVVQRKTYKGTDPPQKLGIFEDGRGWAPDSDIENYLTGLRRVDAN